jgi:hypothetical protein
MRETTSTRGDTKGDETAAALRKLQKMVPEPQEAHGLLMLLGNGMAEALTGVRAGQASLELARATARRSASLDARRAEAEAARDAVTVVQGEVRRLRVTEPRADEHTVGVYGHVLDDGEPVAGAQVGLVDGDQALACVDTDKAGAFALSQEWDQESRRPLALRVMVKDEVVHRDDEATLRPGPVATYRLIELGEATTPPPEQYVCDGGRPEPTQPLPAPGGSLTQTLKDIRAAHASVHVVRLAASDDTTPKVVDVQHGDDGVALEVRGRSTDAGRLAVVASVLAHQPGAERAGVGSAAAATALLKEGEVATWADAQEVATLHPVELAKRFKLDRDQGSALATALAATMSSIEIVEEG